MLLELYKALTALDASFILTYNTQVNYHTYFQGKFDFLLGASSFFHILSTPVLVWTEGEEKND